MRFYLMVVFTTLTACGLLLHAAYHGTPPLDVLARIYVALFGPCMD